ncbi:MAG: transposase [Chloroflexi bacterium]|nr:transposase [Chloroflexota bacterium]
MGGIVELCHMVAEKGQWLVEEIRDRLRAQLRLEQTLVRLCRRYTVDEGAVQGKLCRRIAKFIKELFVFVARPEVPADNNAAERGLRHLVTSRKISGGTRSEKGSQTSPAWSPLASARQRRSP